MTDVESPSREHRADRPVRIPRSRLAALRVGELRDLAASLGVGNASTLRKGPLVDAITESYDTSDTDLREAGSEQAPDGPHEQQQGGADADPVDEGSDPAVDAAFDEGLPTEPIDEAPVDETPIVEAPAEPEPAEARTVEFDAAQHFVTEPAVTASEEAAGGAEAPDAVSTETTPEQLPGADAEPIRAAGTDRDSTEADSTDGDSTDADSTDADSTVTAAESSVAEAEGGAAVSDAVAEQSGFGTSKPAVQHVNAGITGIAEDLEELQRRESGAAPDQNQHDGTHPTDADGEQGERQPGRRGRGRGRGRGQQQDATAAGQNGQQNGQQPAAGQSNGQQAQQAKADAPQNGQQPKAEQPAQQQPQNGQAQNGQAQNGQPQNGQAQNGQQPDRQQQQQDAEGRGRGRYRDRKRRGQGTDIDEPEVRDDDVLIPIAGILDVLDNYAFVRTSGYLAGGNDVYVSLGQVKKYHLRKGDAVVGAIRQIPEAEQPSRQKYNALVKVDSINGLPVAEAEGRVEFEKLTPLYPQERLRLETEAGTLSTRVLDLVSPIGKGTRGLIVAPPKSGKTLMLQAIANAVTKNNPEAHLMVVLVDERPEEVTDMQRSVKGEVIASTFDRPAEDHTTVAELAIERAKRLVELGYDVVVLLDSITRLGRAYNQVVPASGRTLPGGIDTAALFPPKRFFGAARNIENGGSLTIIATALVETGSKADEAVFEEFEGTGNMELRLDRRLADKRIFPAVDVAASGTRREEMLMGPDEVKVTWQLRRALVGLDPQAALDIVLGKMRETGTNVEFLLAMQKSLPGAAPAK